MLLFFVVCRVVLGARAECLQIGGWKSTKLSPMGVFKNVVVSDGPVNVYPRPVANFFDLCVGKGMIRSRGVSVSFWGKQDCSMFTSVTYRVLIGNVFQVRGCSNPSMHTESGRVTGVLEKNLKISSSTIQRLGGVFERHNPRSLIEFQSAAALLIAKTDKEEADERYGDPTNGDFVEFFGGSQVRSAIIGFVSIALIFLGRRLLSYGERIGDVAHDFWWWGGYSLSVVGLVVTSFAVLFGAAQRLLL